MALSTTSQEARVGLISLVALVLLVGGIVWGKRAAFGVEERIVVFTASNTSGVDAGSVITVNGVRKGSVISVQTTPDGVTIQAGIDPTIPLKEDATGTIQMLEITGGKKIEVSVGKSERPLPASAAIPCVVAGDLGAVVGTFDQIAHKVDALLVRIDTTIGFANGLIGSPQLRNGVEQTVENAAQLTRSLNLLVADNRGKLEQTISNLDGTISELRGLLQRSSPGIERSIAAVEQTATDARAVINSSSSVLRRADSLIAHVDGLVGDLRNGNGIVAKLINDSTLTNELMLTLKNARGMIEEIRKYGINTNVSIGRLP
ncbi:MAG: MCE family protein [Chlorobi bacterium CHB2]|nr:MCE family protein [Chlorobi bacterium CHB2]